eukprot:CAMPEP_0174282410 /NCGR_PEP_ID=MMETSP0809-20121228/2917_1 /TAXON_ID=73025 ORGANISM="Eutreptiella gymnastica-like, Strain CCMP1594" /NCGR_SAMPLE_ID=MMETSP0809 /ASSEMBLY_ACC=CAM_ASM_000658 /LENGTH=58 /DNA_ID=CAMNT_0015376591 /DNA_START=157 /DNA_END=330 /DNA_ORIENTATION=-
MRHVLAPVGALQTDTVERGGVGGPPPPLQAQANPLSGPGPTEPRMARTEGSAGQAGRR